MMCRKFLTPLLIWGILSSKSNMVPPYFHLESARINPFIYTEPLYSVVHGGGGAVCFTRLHYPLQPIQLNHGWLKTLRPCHTKHVSPPAPQALTQWIIMFVAWCPEHCCCNWGSHLICNDEHSQYSSYYCLGSFWQHATAVIVIDAGFKDWCHTLCMWILVQNVQMKRKSIISSVCSISLQAWFCSHIPFALYL